ncbi:glutathione S-transferase [alpha proteobacterium AAP81b]|nr:glutathione S-transferase [alpha proteobacterium AAP81b]
MTLTFYTNPMSRGRIARIMLEEVGAPYETVILGYGAEMKADAYRAVNPMGKVPAIVHDGRIVTEGAAICAYLADAFPAAGLAPPIADRADYYRWLFFAAGPVEAVTTVGALGVAVPEEKQMMVGWGSLDAVVDALEAHLADRQWFCGDQFTAADVYAGSQVGWGLQFGSLPPRPALAAYAERLNARPAAVRAREIDDALLAG